VEEMDESPRRHRREAVETPEDIAYILDTVSDKVPSMIKGIIGAFFSPEAAKDMAKSVAEFRKTLIEGGIPEDEAMQMTREYMQTVTNWKGIMSEAKIGEHHHYRDEK
jgi:hypothetical protein